jgi:hypothetical protein
LVEDVGGTADWRAQKAVEYPHDAERNLSAAEDLSALAKSLDDLAEDDPLWRDYAWANEAAILTGRAIQAVEWLNDRLKAIGFHEAAPADGRAFLQEFLQESGSGWSGWQAGGAA